MSFFRLTPSAKADLAQIHRYTRKQWGNEQAQRYSAQLKSDFVALASGKKSGRLLSELDAGLEVYLSQKHYILYLRYDNHIGILGVLHEKMDMLTRIKDRLEKNERSETYH